MIEYLINLYFFSVTVKNQLQMIPFFLENTHFPKLYPKAFK